MSIRQDVARVAVERGLRQSTYTSYLRLLGGIGILDLDCVSEEELLERLWTLENPNTRRATIIAVRSVLGFRIRVPRAVPRRYQLESEDTLRMALMLTPHEPRGLLMMYAGLRVGEACAITAKDRAGDRLRVDKQVQELYVTGQPRSVKVGPVKTNEASIVIPHWLADCVDALENCPVPSSVRESLRRAGNKVGILLNPHMLRHWYCTTLLERGVALALVSRQMRHSDVAVTLRTYAQVDDGDIHRALG
jgi:integrase